MINFLNEEHALLALTFSGQKGVNGDDRFAFGRWTVGATGAPVLQDAVAAFDCALTQELETKTHSIFLGEVRHVGISAEPIRWSMSVVASTAYATSGIRSRSANSMQGD